MDSALAQHLENLRAGLLALPPVGPAGFEGLLASVLSSISGQPFRLASSGSQGGRDGNSWGDGAEVYFEAKRYTDSVPRTAVSDKLLELQLEGADAIDLYLLAASCEISAQHAEFYERACSKMGIDLLLLDWSATGLPELALLMALAPDVSKRFLLEQVGAHSLAAADAVDAICCDPTATGPLAVLQRKLADPAASQFSARAANSQWFDTVFSCRARARQYFGQVLAPMAPAAMPYRPRPSFAAALAKAFVTPPDGSAYIVEGQEGEGKSWLVAATWMESESRPLLAVFCAEEMSNLSDLHDLDALLARKLASQSAQSAARDPQARWRRRLATWAKTPSAEQVRLVVWVDGINQEPQIPWARWIDALELHLSERGCRLVVTSRPGFATSVLPSLTCRVVRIQIDGWSEPELSEILSGAGVQAALLAPAVRESLHNPRLLAIALGLFDQEQIQSFSELSVERLLFEHMRQVSQTGAVRLAPDAFAKTLQRLANEVIGRLARDVTDDLAIFDADLHGGITAAAESRFFSPVAGEPGRYAITNEGLPLALGLWLIRELQSELRNHRDPAAKLDVLLEPIKALDRTAEVVFAALLVACHDEQVPATIGAIVLRHYVILQNRFPDGEPSIVSLARRATGVFLAAVTNAALEGNFPHGLVVEALSDARRDPDAWAKIAEAVRTWLGIRSVRSNRRIVLDDREERAKELARQNAEVDARVAALSSEESRIFNLAGASASEKNVAALHSLAFALLYGKELAEFADHLVYWSLGAALNPGQWTTGREFEQLLRFNEADWKLTRAAMLRAVKPLRAAGVSKTGRWALYRALWATGDVADAAEAEILRADLTKDREPFGSWRLREQYCASDPCDPTSTMPDNVAETVEKFRQVDPARLRRLMGHTAEDHFFKDAGLGVARFCPAVAVAKHRELALDVVGRTGLPLRQGILSLVAHSALLDEKVVDEMIALAVACSNEEIRDLNDRSDLFLVQDRALLAALPHKSGDAQLEILMRLGDTELSYDVVGLFRAADAGLAHERLARALDDRDVVGLRNVLCFLHFSDTRILPGALPLLVGLFSSPDEMVRAHALGITLRTENEGLLRALLASGWSAKTLDPRRNVLEIWLGSRLMGLACQRGLIEACAALERMAFPHYGLIAISGQASAAAVAAKVDMALRRVLAIRDWPQLAEIRQQISDDRDSMPPPMSVALKESSGASKVPVADAETEDDDWERQQACAWQSYDRLSEALTDADARLVLDHLSQDCVDRLVAVDPAVAMNWMSAWLTASKPQKKALGFFGLQLVSALANVGVVDVTFLENVCSVHPMIGVVSGYASVPAIARTLWRNVQSPGLREYCIARLHKAQNNADIAEEVLAALSAGQQQVLDNYIDELLAEEVPARTCRALTVAGFLHKSQNAETIFDRFSEAKGFVGDAVAAAKYAYERDLWAHHWYLKMLAATTNEEFWLHSRLFLKVVDARFSLWSKSKIEGGVIHRTYFPTVIEALEQRFERWRTQRQKELFGGKPP